MRKIVWCSTENFNLTPASQLVSWLNNSTLFNFFVKSVVTFPFYIFEIFNVVNFEFVGFGTKWFLTHWVLNIHAVTVVFFSETILLDSPSAQCELLLFQLLSLLTFTLIAQLTRADCCNSHSQFLTPVNEPNAMTVI